MKLFKPSFYDKFYCIADKCDFTCCRDWNIAVDEDTLEEWENMDIPCKCNLPKGKLTDYVEDEALLLNENMKCHFLNEKGLCNIVLEYGEEALGYACHTFPRVTYDYDTHSEYTLNLGCKYALEKLLECGKFTIVEDEDDYEDEDLTEIPECIFELRDFLLEQSKDTDLSNIQLLKAYLYMITELQNLYEKGESLEVLIGDYLESDVYRNVKEIILNNSSDEISELDAFLEHNEVLIDILEEYVKEEMYSEYINEIYDYANKISRDSLKKKIENTNMFFGEFRNLIKDRVRLIIQNEIYGFIIPSDDDYLNGIKIKLEWLTMETVALEQWLFLIWNKKGTLPLEDFVTTTAVLFRITGFSDEDIDDYLNSEFISDIWDMDYIDLICK